LSQTLDDGVKTIYSPPVRSTEHLHLKGFIVKTRHVVRTTRPIQGPVAFVRAGAMLSFRTCDATAHPVIPAVYPLLDRDENTSHPGEDGA